MRSTLDEKFSGYVFSVLDSFLYPIIFLASTPFFIDKLGEKYFGIWMLANTIFITLQIFNFGIGSSTLRYVSAYRSEENAHKLNSVISINLKFSAWLFIVCIACSALLCYLIQYHGLLNIEPSMLQSTASSVFLTGALVGLKFMEQVFLNAFKSFKRFDLNFYSSSGSRCLTLLINVVQVYYGTDIYRLFLSNIVISALFLLVEYGFLKKLWPAFKFISKNDPGIRKSLFSFGLLSWLQSAFMVLAFQADKFVVVSVFGIEKFGYYSLLATIISQLQMGLGSVSSVFVPSFIALFQQGDTPGLKKLFIKARVLIYVLHVSGLLLFYLLGSTVFILWFGEHKAAKLLELLDYFLLLATAGYLNIVSYAYLNACGREKDATAFTLLLGASSIIAVCTGGFIYHSLPVILILNSAAIGISNVLIELYTNRLVFKKPSLSASLKIISGILFLMVFIAAKMLMVKIIAMVCLIFMMTWIISQYKKQVLF